MTIFKYAVLRGLRSYLSLILNLILPFTLILVKPIWTMENSMGSFYLAMVLMYGSFIMARGILNDRLDGTIVRILAGPVTTFRYLLQNLLACMLPITAQIVIICTIGELLYDWGLEITFFLGLCYTVFVAASIAFSFAWSCLFKNKEVSYAIFSVLMTVIAMLAGFWFPIDIMPQALRYAGALFPAYWASNGINALLSTGVTGEYWMSMAAISFFIAVYLLYGGKRNIV